MLMFRELFGAVWSEPGCAFSDPVVRFARRAVEYEARYRETLATIEKQSHDEDRRPAQIDSISVSCHRMTNPFSWNFNDNSHCSPRQ